MPSALLLLSWTVWAVFPASDGRTHPPAPPPSATVIADSTGPSLSLPARGVDVWMGRSTGPGHVIGKIPDSAFDLFGIRYRRVLTRFWSGRSTITYSGGLVGARLIIPEEARPERRDRTKPVGRFRSTGLGITPFGVEWTPAATARLRPFLSTHGGFIYFFDPVPDRQGKRLNFTASIGAGLHVRVVETTLLTIGYRYHHTSNGFRGQINPGVDANLVYVGITRLLGL